MSQYLLSNVRNDLDGYKQLICFYEKYKDDISKNIDLTINKWFDANLSALLGAIIDKIELKGLNSVKFTVISSNIQIILQKNAFLTFFGFDKLNDTHNTTIEYKKLKPEDTRYFNKYLENDLLNRDIFPCMSDAVHEKISESIQEMFVNAQIHSETEFIYTCGQYFPRDNKINFTIVDTGIGFSGTIEKNLGKKISASDSIRWALVDGHTTKQNVPGGLGLALLKEFITQNKGKIQIISGNAFYELNAECEATNQLEYYYNGSVISMTFKTDDKKTIYLQMKI